MDNKNLNIFLKLLEKYGSDMNNINSFINNLQNNEMDKLKNIFIGKELYCTSVAYEILRRFTSQDRRYI